MHDKNRTSYNLASVVIRDRISLVSWRFENSKFPLHTFIPASNEDQKRPDLCVTIIVRKNVFKIRIDQLRTAQIKPTTKQERSSRYVIKLQKVMGSLCSLHLRQAGKLSVGYKLFDPVPNLFV